MHGHFVTWAIGTSSNKLPTKATGRRLGRLVGQNDTTTEIKTNIGLALQLAGQPPQAQATQGTIVVSKLEPKQGMVPSMTQMNLEENSLLQTAGEPMSQILNIRFKLKTVILVTMLAHCGNFGFTLVTWGSPRGSKGDHLGPQMCFIYLSWFRGPSSGSLWKSFGSCFKCWCESERLGCGSVFSWVWYGIGDYM